MILATLLAGAALAAGLVWHHQASPRHFLEVTPGVLYRSATLRPANLEEVLGRHGIRTVVNLRPINPDHSPAWYREESDVCRRLGVRLVDLPLDDYQVPTAEQVAQCVELLGRKDELPILVHFQTRAQAHPRHGPEPHAFPRAGIATRQLTQDGGGAGRGGGAGTAMASAFRADRGRGFSSYVEE
jgi:protein tyrosine phosphatase (PTP) superfamily phosphohydrolase (DUF442 family)